MSNITDIKKPEVKVINGKIVEVTLYSPTIANANVSKTFIDHVLSVEEELQSNGFNVKLIKEGYLYFIEFETIAGIMKYSCSEKTVMGDFYRFISHYGRKMYEWGLSMKLKQP